MRAGQGEEGNLLVRLSHAKRAAKGGPSLQHIAPSPPLCMRALDLFLLYDVFLAFRVSELQPPPAPGLRDTEFRAGQGKVRRGAACDQQEDERDGACGLPFPTEHARLRHNEFISLNPSIHSSIHPYVIHPYVIHSFSCLAAQP
jgi:hypothetical protein